MDAATESAGKNYNRRGAPGLFMYSRRHPSSGVNAVPLKMSEGQFGPYYHASDTEFKPGDLITSLASRGETRPVNAPALHATDEMKADREHKVYAGFSKFSIDQFGSNKYEVEPTGHVHADPEAPEMAVTSYAPFRVVRKIG